MFNPVPQDDPVVKELTKLDEIEKRAYELLSLWGLDEWSFAFTNDIHTMGWCSYRDKEIRFSKKYTHHEWKDIDDTLLHEIAHALVGHKVKAHGYEWRQMARHVGARPQTCAESHVRPKDVPDFKYLMKCPSCGRKWYRHRMKKRNFGSRCPNCQVSVEIFTLRRKEST